MAGYIVIGKGHIYNIIDEIKVTQNRDYNTSAYAGGEGSTTNHISTSGRVLTFSNLITPSERYYDESRIIGAKKLAKLYSKKVGVLTSPSRSKLNGNYLCTGFDYTEDTGGNFICNWEFTEVIKFNATRKTFRVWGKAVSSSSKAKKTTTKTSSNSSSNLNSNVKLLLKSCPLMSKGHTGKKCVMSLQKFLQSKGYYKNYKVDGEYAIYTEQAVTSLQKKFKLKATGKWDKATRNYFQKQYKYPTNVK